jgi:tetratricopeptide (TPR) repeat protein
MSARFAALVAVPLLALALAGKTTATNDPPTSQAAAELYAKGDWAGAARAYAVLTEKEPEKGLNWYRLGASRLALKEYKPALAGFEAALKCGAPEGQVRYGMARAHAKLSEKDAAIACLEKSAAIGFARAEVVTKEDDLTSLRDDPRFAAVVQKLENPTKGMKGADAMDHWIGEWDVFVGNQQVGGNKIARTMNGFGVEESWESGTGGRGRSLFVFVAAKGQWKQLWTSDMGWVVEKIGTPVENGIYLEGTSTYANGTVKKSREHLTRNPDGSVRQHLEDWDEAAKEWKTTFDAKYVRKASK